jgi:hypothetical protein
MCALGLLSDDREFIDAINEIVVLCFGSYVRNEGILRGVFQNFNPLCGRNPIETDLD